MEHTEKRQQSIQQNRSKQTNLIATLTLVIITILLITAIFTHLLVLPTLPADLIWIVSLFIALYTPFYYMAKRKYPAKIKQLLYTHIYGNLISVMLIAIHVAQETIKPQPIPTFATGMLLGIIMILLVTTGFLLRFQPNHKKAWRYTHGTITILFYIVLIMHVIISLNYIPNGLAILTAVLRC